jgi:hypothetical protein
MIVVVVGFRMVVNVRKKTMGEYTPTTEEVREQWREQWSYNHEQNGKEQRDAQFDRWLAEHDAELVALIKGENNG